MKKSSLGSHSFFQFSPHFFKKAPVFNVEMPVLFQWQVTDCMGETGLNLRKIIDSAT